MAKKFTSLLAAILVIGGGATLATTPNYPDLDEGVASHDGMDEIYHRFSEGYEKLDAAAVANLYTETVGVLTQRTRRSTMEF